MLLRRGEQPEIARLFVVLDAEAFAPEHPAHEFFAHRRRLLPASVESMLGWADDPAIAARELLSFWHGLEALRVADQTVDVLAVRDRFAAKFFADPGPPAM